MSEFPEDVLFVARSLVWPQYLGNEATVERIIMGECDSWPLVITAAKAIMAERERCAKVAMNFVRYSYTEGGTAVNPFVNAMDIVAAIRHGEGK